MKKIFLLLVVCCFISIAGNGQEVEAKQSSLITKFTATWCPNCGTWGWDFFKNVVEDNDANAISWAVHFSGTLVNSASSGISANFDFAGQPVFFVNEVNQAVNFNNTDIRQHDIQLLVEQNASQSPLANAGIIATMDDNEIVVQAKAKFFEETEGEYFLALYVIEHNLVHEQSPLGSNAVHTKVLRASFTNFQFGNPIVNGPVEANAEFNQSYTLDLNPAWATENLEIAAIIWKKEESKFTFVNGIKVNEFSEPVAVKEITPELATMSLYPNISVDQMNIIIDLNKRAVAELNIYNLKSELVKTVYRGELNKGEHQFLLNKGDQFAPGLYFARLHIDNKIISSKLVFK